jgi:hypothetical protein
MSASDLYMIAGFLLAGYAVVANDAIQTLGTFLSSNAHRPWWILWLYACAILVTVFAVGYFLNDGDLSYGRLANFPEVQDFTWLALVPPLVILVLTNFGIPVSTTFLILTVFHPAGFGGMLTKSLIGYGLAMVLGFLVFRFVLDVFERRFIETARREPATYWVVLQWLSTAFLWSQWLIQDLANIAVYLPRHFGLETLLAVVGVLLLLHAWIFYRRGGEIQRIVTTKINTQDIRSATIIDFLYGLILIFFKELNSIPMSTTWVFLGLLGGREFGIAMTTYLRSERETAMIVVKDAFKGALGLGVSVIVALGIPALL